MKKIIQSSSKYKVAGNIAKLTSPLVLRLSTLIVYCFLALTSVQAQIITTVVGNGTAGYGGDGGQATAAQIQLANRTILDAMGNMYIADTYNNRIQKVNTLGIISTIAGDGSMNYTGDGGLATAAELSHPSSVAIDALGNIYIADFDNKRIRKINSTGIISTIAGNGAAGNNGDGGQATAAKIVPNDIILDIYGNEVVKS